MQMQMQMQRRSAQLSIYLRSNFKFSLDKQTRLAGVKQKVWQFAAHAVHRKW